MTYGVLITYSNSLLFIFTSQKTAQGHKKRPYPIVAFTFTTLPFPLSQWTSPTPTRKRRSSASCASMTFGWTTRTRGSSPSLSRPTLARSTGGTSRACAGRGKSSWRWWYRRAGEPVRRLMSLIDTFVESSGACDLNIFKTGGARFWLVTIHHKLLFMCERIQSLNDSHSKHCIVKGMNVKYRSH